MLIICVIRFALSNDLLFQVFNGLGLWRLTADVVSVFLSFVLISFMNVNQSRSSSFSNLPISVYPFDWC